MIDVFFTMTEHTTLMLDSALYPFEEDDFIDDIQNKILRAMENLQSLDIKAKKSFAIFALSYIIIAFFVCKFFTPKKKGKLKIKLKR